MSGAEGFLFDLDGTLIDSSALHERSFRKALRAYSPELAASFVYRDALGLATEEALCRIGVAENALAAVATAKRRYYRAAVARGELRPLDGATTVLEALREDRRPLAVVTSGSRGSAEAALQSAGLGGFFDVKVFAEDVRNTKPSAEPYTVACGRLGVAAATSVVVEDAQAGVAAGRAAGCIVIGVHNEELRPKVDEFFYSLAELSEAVKQP